MLNRKIIGSIAIATILVSSTAYAFSRNLSGLWKTDDGPVAIAHNTSDSSASLTRSFKFKGVSPITITYNGRVSGEDDSTQFHYSGSASDVAFENRAGHLCTLSDILIDAQGTLIGQFPNRKIRMNNCSTLFSIKCTKDGHVVFDDMIGTVCIGDWE